MADSDKAQCPDVPALGAISDSERLYDMHGRVAKMEARLHDMEDHGPRIRKLENFRNWAAGTAGGVGLILGVTLVPALDYLEKVLHVHR